MDVITKDVRALAKKELAAANRRFRMFASPHEGYAVIREELDELIDEVRKLHFGLTIRLWRDVKRNEPMKREHLNLIYDVAIHAAVEAIQLAAMVKKYERSQRHDFPEGGQWVDFYEPMNRSDQPMPKVELKLKGEEK